MSTKVISRKPSYGLRHRTTGNIWNLGEYPEEYEEGKFSAAPDVWLAGIAGAEAGNSMLGDPQLGTPEYLQGWSPDIEFLDCAKVSKMQQDLCTGWLLRERDDH